MRLKHLLLLALTQLFLMPILPGQTVSKYPAADAVVMEAAPDSVIDQDALNGNILAYRTVGEDGLVRVQSYVNFDISDLAGTQVESVALSYRGKTGATDFVDLFDIELFGLKAGFDAETLTWNNQPGRDKKLATSTLNSSSARKAFVNVETRLTDYLNEEIRKGATEVAFLIRSAGKDSTDNMWIGGADNGNYAPVLSFNITPQNSSYAVADAVVMEAHPDSAIDQSALNGNILAFRDPSGGTLQRVQSYVAFDISHLNGQQLESAGFSYRGKTGAEDFADSFELELFSLKSGFDAQAVTWNSKPGRNKKLAVSTLNTSSARKDFINEGSRLVDYLNEEIRKGAATVGFLIRSTGKDSTDNMWIGGMTNGNYGPVLDYDISPQSSNYALSDALVMEAHPDSVIDQEALNGNLLAYRDPAGGALQRVQSFVKFDISHLKGQQVESAGLSYRGKTGVEDFAGAFNLELFSLKDGFDAEILTWNNQPGRDKKLAASTLNTSSARKDFINEGTRLIDYLNEAIREGAAEVGFLIRSAGKDSTDNMWIGGLANGNYGPVLDYTLAPAKSCYGLGDAVVLEAFPDSTLDQSAVNGNILAYRDSGDSGLQYVQSYVQFDISGLKREVESASLSYRGKTGAEDFAEEFGLELFSLKAGFDAETVTWNTRPGRDKKLGTSSLNSSSARKAFVNEGNRFVDYLNEAIRKGSRTIGFLLRSAAKDSTDNMWIGGIENGNYGPVLEVDLPSLFKLENDTLTVIEDVFVSQAEPDTNFEIEDADMHLILDTTNMASKEIYLKFDISEATAGVGTATLLLRGAQKDPPSQEENFRIRVFGADDNAWSEGSLTWNTRPAGTTGALVEYNITESKYHEVGNKSLTAYVNEALESGQDHLTFVIRAKEETAFRAWISSKNWMPAKLALDYSSQDKTVIEDTYVSEANPDENYDGITAMQVARDTMDNNDRETFLTFDLANARSNLVSATLILKADQEQSATVLDDFFIQVHGVDDTSWEDSTLTWNEKPAISDPLLVEYNVNRSADHEVSSADLTNYVKEAIRNKKGFVSFAIQGKENTPGSNVWISDQGWRPARLFIDYRQVTADPVFLTPEGEYIPEVTVELAAQTPGSTIYYTLDGSEPTDKSTEYTGPFTLTDTATVRARAFAQGLAASDIVEATYLVAPVGVPVFSPNASLEFQNNVTVAIEVLPEDAFLFYSTDGGEPLTPYPSDGILLTETTTLRARGVSADGSFLGPIAEATYTIVNAVAGTGTGPGGVGAPDNTIAGQPENVLWLKADVIQEVADGDQVKLWPDQSGNANDAYNTYMEGGDNGIPNTGESQKPAPTYYADSLNGKPVLQFGLPENPDPTNRSLIIDDADNLDGGAGLSIFMVFKRNELFSDFAAVFQKRNITAGAAAQAYVLEFNGGSNPNKMQFVIERQSFLRNDLEFNAEDYYIVNAELQDGFGDMIFRTNGIIEKVATHNGIVPAVDAPLIIGGFQPMNIAEVILYKNGLNVPQNTIVHNYLATKYGLPLSLSGDELPVVYNNQAYIEDLIGIGADLYIDNESIQTHRTASGAGLQIDARSQLNVGDYLMAAHNGAEITDPSSWDRHWNVEVAGTSPNVDLIFDFEAAGLDLPPDPEAMKLFYNDGSGWSDMGLTPEVAEEQVIFQVDGIQPGVYTISSSTVSIREIDHSDLLSVYPNPVSGEALTLNLENGIQGELTIQVFDLLGKVVYQENTEKHGSVFNRTLHLTQLPNGVYSVKLLLNGKYSAVKKIIKH